MSDKPVGAESQFPLTPHGQCILDRFRVAIHSARPMHGGKISDPLKWMTNVACKILEEILMTPEPLRQDKVGAESQPERDQVAREVAERLDRESFETDGGPAVYLKTATSALLDKELECRRLREALEKAAKWLQDAAYDSEQQHHAKAGRLRAALKAGG